MPTFSVAPSLSCQRNWFISVWVYNSSLFSVLLYSPSIFLYLSVKKKIRNSKTFVWGIAKFTVVHFRKTSARMQRIKGLKKRAGSSTSKEWHWRISPKKWNVSYTQVRRMENGLWRQSTQPRAKTEFINASPGSFIKKWLVSWKRNLASCFRIKWLWAYTDFCDPGLSADVKNCWGKKSDELSWINIEYWVKMQPMVFFLADSSQFSKKNKFTDFFSPFVPSFSILPSSGSPSKPISSYPEA